MQSYALFLWLILWDLGLSPCGMLKLFLIKRWGSKKAAFITERERTCVFDAYTQDQLSIHDVDRYWRMIEEDNVCF